ncbi:putative conserved secreted protein [Synechococcus sp. A18-40]|nr:putative conserved secreted protein [Synechococcus sp. A18-40]
MTSSLCLSVLVGCPASPTQLPEGPCLIINAESIDRKELIAQESFYAHYRELSADDIVLLNQTVISEFDHQIVEWHSFSDRRFNGPSQLSEFSEQYPNLRLIESWNIEGITLSTVLMDQKSLSDPLSTFELILREGDPLVALQSAKEWLARCTRISLRGLVTSSKSREAAEAFLGASGFCKSSVDSCVWTPELEVSSLHLSLIRCGLLALFNADVYRKLYPQTQEMTDIELIDHWLSQPDFREIAKEIDENTHNSLDRDGILASFNADIYRKLYPQTQEMTDVELIDHWLSQPDFRDVSKIMKDATQRNPTPLAELTDQDPALQLLQNIFPFDFYRSQRTDLSQIPNRELINHYWTHGQYEGIDLSESNVKNVLDKDQSLQVNRLNTRIHELEHLLSCANAQISAMQKLIVSSRDSGATNEQD